MEKVKTRKIVIVRACVGCSLPETAKLIGTGAYNFIKLGNKETEQYYDYQIYDDELDEFLDQNEAIMAENGLVKLPEPELSKEEIRELTENRGYRRKP